MLATPSLGKRPTKVTTLKSFRLPPPPPPPPPPPSSHEHVKRFLSKCSILKADLLQDHQTYCLQARMCALFSLEILQAVAVKRLIIMMYSFMWYFFGLEHIAHHKTKNKTRSKQTSVSTRTHTHTHTHTPTHTHTHSVNRIT